MIVQIKRLASKLPQSIILELKRWYYARQCVRSEFNAGEIEYELLPSWLKEGDWAIDVGANIGQYTKKMSELVGEKGRVIAFEPVLETFYLLASNVSRFKNSNNVTLVNAAVSDKTEVLGIDIPKLESGLDNFYQAHLIASENARSVLCLPIDSFNILEKIKFVKIDAEGHELHVLRGMNKILKRDHPVIVVENNSDDIENYLNDFGYKKDRKENSANLIFV
jgi:FkbM family methyltransferase